MNRHEDQKQSTRENGKISNEKDFSFENSNWKQQKPNSKTSYHLSKDDQKAIKEYLNLGGDITDLLSRKFSIKRSRKAEEELKLKLKLAELEIFELKSTLLSIETKAREEKKK